MVSWALLIVVALGVETRLVPGTPARIQDWQALSPYFAITYRPRRHMEGGDIIIGGATTPESPLRRRIARRLVLAPG